MYTQILQDKPHPDFIIQICQLKSTCAEAPNQVSGEHAHRWSGDMQLQGQLRNYSLGWCARSIISLSHSVICLTTMPVLESRMGIVGGLCAVVRVIPRRLGIGV